jgi:hypothetical protein
MNNKSRSLTLSVVTISTIKDLSAVTVPKALVQLTYGLSKNREVRLSSLESSHVSAT